jgi:hypothetical protein
VCRPSPKQRLAPPVQGHDTHTQRARNFALQLPLPRQTICLCEFPRDFPSGFPRAAHVFSRAYRDPRLA